MREEVRLLGSASVSYEVGIVKCCVSGLVQDIKLTEGLSQLRWVTPVFQVGGVKTLEFSVF